MAEYKRDWQCRTARACLPRARRTKCGCGTFCRGECCTSSGPLATLPPWCPVWLCSMFLMLWVSIPFPMIYSGSTAWYYAGLLCNLSLGWRDSGMLAQNAATILKPLRPNPHSTRFTHVANWVAPFPCSQHSSPFKFLYNLPPLLPSLKGRGPPKKMKFFINASILVKFDIYM